MYYISYTILHAKISSDCINHTVPARSAIHSREVIEVHQPNTLMIFNTYSMVVSAV